MRSRPPRGLLPALPGLARRASCSALALALLVGPGTLPLDAQAGAPDERLRILLTNDDGMVEYDDRLLPVASALSRVADVTIVVPSTDRSGSSTYSTVSPLARALDVDHVVVQEPSPEAGGIELYSVDGYPVDCVALGVAGVLRETPPDLVISGPNGGPNLGAAWMFSGTVGAARAAALYGFPAIAVSGLDDSDAAAVSALAAWLVRLATSETVLGLEDGRYLTIGLPRRSPSAIRGIRFARRVGPLALPTFERAESLRSLGAEDRSQVWLFQPPTAVRAPAGGTDVALYQQGYIVVTPMRAAETDEAWLAELRERPDALPAWPPEEER